MFLSRVKSASKLDSYTGLPLPEDELGATKSTPLLLEGPSTSRWQHEPLSPLLDQVLRGESLRDSVGVEGTSSLQELGGRDKEEEEEKRTSSFVDILESRVSDMDQAWMDTQVASYRVNATPVGTLICAI